MGTYILVHGGDISTDTWNYLTKRNDYPLGKHLGGEVWKNTAIALRNKGHIVFTPTLKNACQYDLTYHIKQICDVMIERNLNDVLLVGHSYGGMVITGVADKVAERINTLIYLDAALPEPGQSLFDLLTLGGFDPKKVVGGEQKAYIENLYYDPTKLAALKKVFIFCTKSEFASVVSLAKEKINENKTNWHCYKLPTSHIPQCTLPEKLYGTLIEIEKLHTFAK